MLIYRTLLRLASPLIVLWLLWRRASGRDDRAALCQRLARGAMAPEAVRLWIHGASNGELASARWLIAGLIGKSEGLEIVVTCNTVTAREMVAGWKLPRVEAVLAPIDTAGAVRRFLNRWHPRALVILENEIWPNRISLCAEHGVAVLLLGARMSAKSAVTWGRMPRLTARLMAAIHWLSAQDAGSEERFRALGLPAEKLGPVVNLKARPAVSHSSDLLLPDELRSAFHPACTLLAASTHSGEDEILLEGFARAREAGDIKRLILAPRHPRRSAEIAALITAAGLDFATRSAKEPPGDAAVFLADTLGEMELWYRLAGVTFVGGSFVPAGGHTPFEPARHGSALLHGPQVANFAEAYAALDRTGGAIRVEDATGLARALAQLSDPVNRAAMAARARSALDHPAAEGEAAIHAVLAEVMELPELSD